MPDRLRVGIVGAGYWGPNVIRTFAGLPDAVVAWVCDRRPGRLRHVAETFPGIPLTDRFDDLLTDRTLDAVAIVTPVPTHRALAEAALRAGKHVFVEKPLAGSGSDAEAIVRRAERANRVLATGHVFVYHPALVLLRDALRRGALGQPCYVETTRINLGPPESEVDVIWDLAVHDVAVVLSLIGEAPVEVAAEGQRYRHARLDDVAFLRLRFAGGFVARLHVSWLSPLKVRRLFLVGTDGSATFDDLKAEDKLVLAGRGVDSRVGASDSDSHALAYHAGETRAPALPPVLPLTAECAHFLYCIREGRTPLADGRAGLAVVRVLEAASRSAALRGTPISIDERLVS